ncbi:helix-turn-helix domain-containing protein [Kitasatospora sp. NPDC089913]
MSVAEVAAYLQKPKSWVYAQWKSEGIPFRRVGSHLRCRPTDLEMWIDNR